MGTVGVFNVVEGYYGKSGGMSSVHGEMMVQ